MLLLLNLNTRKLFITTMGHVRPLIPNKYSLSSCLVCQVTLLQPLFLFNAALLLPPFALFTLPIADRLHCELNSMSPSPLGSLKFDSCVKCLQRASTSSPSWPNGCVSMSVPSTPATQRSYKRVMASLTDPILPEIAP